MKKSYKIGNIIELDNEKYTVTGIERLQDLGEGFWPVSTDSDDYLYNPIIWLVSVKSEQNKEFEMFVLDKK